MIMWHPPQRTRWATFFISGMLVVGLAGYGQETAWAWGSRHSSVQGGTLTAQQANLTGIRTVRPMPDGQALLVESDRPLRGRNARTVTVLRFQNPDRVVADIPNTRLLGAKPGETLPPIRVNRQGIDRIELAEISGTFYNAVRVTVYTQDAATLAGLAPSLEGNILRLNNPHGNENGAVAHNASPPRVMAATSAMPGFSTGSPSNSAGLRPAASHRNTGVIPPQPIPPVAGPLASLRLSSPGQSDASQTRRPVGDDIPADWLDTADRHAAGSVPPSSMGMNRETTIFGTPLADGMSVIESVAFRNQRLIIQAREGQRLRISSRLVLSDPSRLVVDLGNAVVANRSLLGLVTGESGVVRQARVGQFDEKTVRLVIETPDPERFETVLSGGSQNLLTLIPASSNADRLRALSESRPGEIESIDLKRESGGTVLRLAASTPIVHRLDRRDNRLTLNLLNESAHPANIRVDSRQYPEIAQMLLEAQGDNTPDRSNSRLSIVLSGRNVRVLPPLLSDGGKVMELLVVANSAGNANEVISNMGGGTDNLSRLQNEDRPAGMAPFPARIVVDAGHGGKDMGANRNGVNEKDLNLSLALMLRDALAEKGFKVYMTRNTDVFLPLPQITAITNQIHPDLFISIHHNASVNPEQHGIETYFFTPQSQPLASRVQRREISLVGERDGGVKQARFYVIHHTDVPAILCEVGYVSNPAELNSLQSMERKMRTARAIADGVVDYLQTRVSARAR